LIPIDIDPSMFTIGGLTVTWHGFFTAVGVLVGVILTARLAPRVGITDDQVYSAATWIVIGGIIGARLLFVLERFENYRNNLLNIFLITEGGISIYGAIIGGFIAGALYCRSQRISVGRFADITAPGLALGLGLGRIGDIINGEHHGVESNLPWSVRYVHPNTAGEPNVSVHPAVAYEMIWDVVVAYAVWRARPLLPRDGMAFIVFAILYSAGRFLFGFLRTDEAKVFGGALSVPQVIALVVMLVGLPLLFYLNRRPPASDEVEETEGVEEVDAESPLAASPRAEPAPEASEA
jgi:phosphatidylglycerol:prolipoprotein diacylglycerol transferase